MAPITDGFLKKRTSQQVQTRILVAAQMCDENCKGGIQR
jgi:hypothetical protein